MLPRAVIDKLEPIYLYLAYLLWLAIDGNQSDERTERKPKQSKQSQTKNQKRTDQKTTQEERSLLRLSAGFILKASPFILI